MFLQMNTDYNITWNNKMIILNGSLKFIVESCDCTLNVKNVRFTDFLSVNCLSFWVGVSFRSKLEHQKWFVKVESSVMKRYQSNLADKHPQLNEFLTQIKNTPDLANLFETIQKDSGPASHLDAHGFGAGVTSMDLSWRSGRREAGHGKYLTT